MRVTAIVRLLAATDEAHRGGCERYGGSRIHAVLSAQGGGVDLPLKQIIAALKEREASAKRAVLTAST